MCHRLSFTVNSAVLCILNKHKLWSYIYTVCAFIWKEIYIIWSLEGAGWHIYWWWKAEINLQSVWCQCLWMSTKSQGYEICCLCLCTAHRLSTQARLTTPSAYNHSAVDPETVSLTSSGSTHIPPELCRLPNGSWIKTIPLNSFLLYLAKLVQLLLAQGQMTKIWTEDLQGAASILKSVQWQAFTVSFLFSWLLMWFENVPAIYQCLSLVPPHAPPHQWHALPHTVCQRAWDTHSVTISTSPT